MRRYSIIVVTFFSIFWPRMTVAWQGVAGLPLEDRGGKRDLLLAVDRVIAYLKTQPNQTVRVGDARVSTADLLRGAQEFTRIVIEAHGTPAFEERVRAAFRIYRTSHPSRPGKAHFTAYYDPVVEARTHPDGAFRYPIYARPPDLIEQNGRAYRLVGGRHVPYYTRRDIEEKGVLSGRGLEIAWVADYVELHYLHIQGAALLRFPGGTQKTLHVSGTNGHSFKSPGRMMIDEGLSNGAYDHVKNYLRTHPDVARRILRQNPRFIFFRMDDKLPSGSAGIPITPGRSIATDKSLYAPGALAFVRYDAPVLDAGGHLSGTRSTSRFVTDCDTGAAITGSGRADLYVGSGPRAEKLAGATNTYGELYYLLPR
ncbi:MAG: MltA domain-containing protein [Deltaproteobacteria bacterium]|nr:MltA domain-containing protein [Deltaproteobacteria bacterium]